MVAKKTTTASKKEEVELDIEDTKNTYKPKKREIEAFQIGKAQPEWFKEAVANHDLNTFLPPIKDPLHYDVEKNDDLVVIMPDTTLFNAGSWVVKDVDGFHGYTDENFKKLFE